MPKYNIIPFGYLYSFIIDAKNEEEAFKKMESILTGLGVSNDELDLYLLDATIELQLKETNL